MKLEINGESVSHQATPALIAGSVEKLKDSKDAFAILSKDQMTYIQFSINHKTGFIMEYQDGSIENHYRSVEFQLSPKVVTDTFVSYLASDDRWRKAVAWEKIDLSKGSLEDSKMVLYVVIGVVLLLGACLFKIFWK